MTIRSGRWRGSIRALVGVAVLVGVGLSASVGASAEPAGVVAPPRVWAVAGTGLPHRVPVCGGNERCGIGDRATDVRYPYLLGVDPAGNMYFGGLNARQVIVVGLDGRLDRAIDLPFVDLLAFGRGGELYFTKGASSPGDEPGYTVWSWDPATRRATRIAGRWPLGDGVVVDCGNEGQPVCEFSQDVPATRAVIVFPEGLAVDRAGRLVIANRGRYVLQRIEHDSTLRTIAGTGQGCFTEDECLQTRTLLAPSQIATGRDGSTWFVSGYRYLYRIAPNGKLRLVWAPATKHPLSTLAVDRNGNVVIGYWPTGAYAQLVRVSPAGRVAPILDAGAHPDPRNERTFGDGQHIASAGAVRQIMTVATTRNGDIYFTDQSGEVRYIPAPGKPPARLALAVFAPASARLSDTVRIAFRTDAAATISVRVAPNGIAHSIVRTPGTAGTIMWHPSADDRRLARHPFVLQIIATDARGRSATRIIP
jgi:hypothetical protein